MHFRRRSCFVVGLPLLLLTCVAAPPFGRSDAAALLGSAAHRQAVMQSRFCAGCHPADYAEHRQNTHGRAFFDTEARLATRGFRRDDCIRCHTPRPVFETGIGMTPMARWTDLAEGNTCMSCHGRAGYDYSRFQGGADCKVAFDPEVGSVTACATCHRIAGTPDQWSRAEHGKLAGRVCIDCHMPRRERPVAVGQPARSVRSHLFPASSSESQLRRAYRYDAAVSGSDVVVRITNAGTGHNFPTANRQRAVESLVIVRDAAGNEVARSRLVCRYPYAAELEPHQRTAPRSSQIPSGKTTEHRVPLTVPGGTVECRLYFKLYRPSADTDPELSRCLEERRLPFDGVTPTGQAVEPEMEVTWPIAPTELADFLSPTGLANTARPAGGGGPVELPAGNDAAELERLAAMLESHLPEVRRLVRQRLAERFPASAEVLVAALGRWSNESFEEAKRTFRAIGRRAVPVLLSALAHPQLYVRVHARELLARLELPLERDTVLAALRPGLTLPNPLDRRSTAQALGGLHDPAAIPLLRPCLDDDDDDVGMAVATALAALGDREAVPAIERALQRTPWPEARAALAMALAQLGSTAGAPALLADLDDADVLPRERAFAAWFSITGVHCGYEPAAPPAERLKALARLQAWWSEHGPTCTANAPASVAPGDAERIWDLVEQLGGGTDTRPGGDDDEVMAELRIFGRRAVPGLIEGLTFPSGFADKRALVCRLLGEIGDPAAAPFLAAALRDPVPAVTEWACWALGRLGDREVLAQLRQYQDRAPASVGADRGAGSDAPADRLLAAAGAARLALGEEAARTDLVNLLLSQNAEARAFAIAALVRRYGDDRGYAADAPAAERRAAVRRWQQ